MWLLVRVLNSILDWNHNQRGKQGKERRSGSVSCPSSRQNTSSILAELFSF